MSPKAKAAAAPKSSKSPAKAAAAAPAAKGPAKKAASGGKAAAQQAAPAPVQAGAENIDLEELEEQADEAAAASSGGNSSAAALAAAATGTNESASFKNFRHHPDMENFYRFIYENDLRHEALDIIDVIMTEKQARKQVKTAKASAH